MVFSNNTLTQNIQITQITQKTPRAADEEYDVPFRRGKAYVYCRVSTYKNKFFSDNAPSLDKQSDVCHEFCQEEGIKIHKIIEETKSAKDGTNFKTLYKILEDMFPGDILIIYKIDRFSRNVLESLKFLEELANKGCDIYSVHDDISYSTMSERFAFREALNHAQYESERVSLRSVNSRRIKNSRKSSSPSVNKVNVIDPENLRPLKKRKRITHDSTRSSYDRYFSMIKQNE